MKYPHKISCVECTDQFRCYQYMSYEFFEKKSIKSEKRLNENKKFE